MHRTSAVRGAMALGASGLAIAIGAFSLAASTPAAETSFDSQVQQGRTAYVNDCAACHGNTMDNGTFAPALKGASFQAKWGGQGTDKLYDYIRASMPPGNTGGLPDETYAAIVAAMLAENGAKLNSPLRPDAAQLAAIIVPKEAVTADAADVGFGGISTRRPLPDWPARPDRFAAFTPVTDAMLNAPAGENWLAWRGSHTGQGFSPLKQIDTGNVKNLTVAWAQSLPAGPNMAEPLVRDGVMYAYGFGDEVFALDATNGDVLWRYQRKHDAPPATSKKTIALYGDKVLLATGDLHMVALDARTGKPVWDVPITDKPGFRIPGGPLAADGVVMIGMATQEAGGGQIDGFEIETGKHLWTFHTVARPGAPGGDTWNGLPLDKRHGGSVWTSGSYDAENKLALWGVAQTYDTGPLRDRKPGMNNDGLYNDATLALNPRTGELVWYFQHMKNDQWDLDWVFDRVIGTLERNGKQQRVVMTAGKIGLFDTVDAKTGKYLSTLDMGIQDIVTGVDPKTGDKIYDPAKIPDGGAPFFACPNGGGGRNWSPTAFNQGTGHLFVNARDVCMDIVPGKPGFLTTGINMRYAAPEGSDGRYGMLQGLDMQNRKIAWTVHQRAPYSMGILATAGGLLFTGSVDRQFIAYDQADGKVLWRTGVTDIPNASPISYSVDGKQYIAIVTGRGNPLSFGLGALTPEIQLPPVNSSAIYVYALPAKED